MKHNYSNPQAVPLVLERFDYRPILYAFLVLSLFLFGIKPTMGQSNTSEPWTLHSTSGSVSVYYMFSKCEQQDVVLIKFNNTGPAAVEVSWKEKLALRGNEVYSTDVAKKLLLSTGETVANDCGSENASVLVVPAYKYVSLLRPGLTKFEISEFVSATQK